MKTDSLQQFASKIKQNIGKFTYSNSIVISKKGIYYYFHLTFCISNFHLKLLFVNVNCHRHLVQHKLLSPSDRKKFIFPYNFFFSLKQSRQQIVFFVFFPKMVRIKMLAVVLCYHVDTYRRKISKDDTRAARSQRQTCKYIFC